MRGSYGRLKLWPLVFTIFFCVSGGPNGLEELVGVSGSGMAILLILVTPFLWAIPAALMTAELTARMPVEGGFYFWVRTALGPCAGFLCGVWTWMYSWVDVAIYPVLFADIVIGAMKLRLGDRFIQDHVWASWLVGSPWGQWVLALAVIVPFTIVNVRGIALVGAASETFAVILLAPFALLSLIGLIHWIQDPKPFLDPLVLKGGSFAGAFGAGLFVVMWNYLGWDSMSTTAGEVEQPSRSFPKALMIGVPLIVIVYLLPTIGGLVNSPDRSTWASGSWPAIAQAAGGLGLFWAILVANLVSCAGLFNATLLASSRVPFAMATDGYFPPALTRLDPRFGTPMLAILVSSVIYSIFAFQSFQGLVVVDVVLYSAALLLEFAALLAVRWRERGVRHHSEENSYRIPGSWPMVIVVAILPTALIVFAVIRQTQEEGMPGLWVSAVALAFGLALYVLLRKRPWMVRESP